LCNSCYIISLLQCIFHLEKFSEIIIEFKSESSKDNSINVWKNLFIELKYNNNKKYIIPNEFINEFFGEIVDIKVQKDVM